MKRRQFIAGSLTSGGALLLPRAVAGQVERTVAGFHPHTADKAQAPLNPLPDLSPARWIWYPSGRCLPNTFILFRRQVELDSKVVKARGWIAADSRYLLEVNGQRIQWGPAPSDPRWAEADPVDLSAALDAGMNVIGAKVVWFGQGDGTWPAGKPGFLFWLEIETASGQRQTIVSDAGWQAHLARSWRPGNYKRWYLRALQEEFNARLYPYGWTTAQFQTTQDWIHAMTLDCPADKPPLVSNYSDYMYDTAGDEESCQLRGRSVPHLAETLVPAAKLTESCWIDWVRPPEEYFECRPPESFRADRQDAAQPVGPRGWQVDLDGHRGAALTFEFTEQMVGWPYFTIEAPAGTTIELMVQEAHQPGGPALLNTHFDGWTRFICREGENRFETFDYESCRWVQLHVHGAHGKVVIRDVGMRRRVYPWPNTPHIHSDEPELQRLFDASLNTLNNSAQETVMDGAGRERQQYSGDGAHQLHAIYLALGETRLPARFVNTFSQGMTQDGYFLDCWPAYDRLARLWERQLQLTKWGPILDHSVGFNFDCFYYHLYTGDLKALAEPYPRLLRFAQYLGDHVGRDGLLGVENLGIPSVWIDHVAYEQQRHKQCAFNLYAGAMLQHALAPLCAAFGDRSHEQSAKTLGRQLQAATVKRFWSPERKLFVINLPWLAEDKKIRLCDRSLATAILYDQCPGGEIAAGLHALVDCPPEMGFSYPCNAGWRLWALGKAGRADVIVKDFRERWAVMESVKLNNTLQEDWHDVPDTTFEWSHCPLSPIFVTHMSVAGIRPLEPGFKRCEIRPQPADLRLLELTLWTVQGPIGFSSRGKSGNRELSLSLPAGCTGELVVRPEESLTLPAAAQPTADGLRRYRLPSGETKLQLKFT